MTARAKPGWAEWLDGARRAVGVFLLAVAPVLVTVSAPKFLLPTAAADVICYDDAVQPTPVQITCPTVTTTVTATETTTVLGTVTQTATETTTVTDTTTTTATTTEFVTIGSAVTVTSTVTVPVTQLLTTTQVVTSTAPGVTTFVPTTVSGSTVEVTRWAATVVNPDSGRVPSIIVTVLSLGQGATVRVTGTGFSPGERIEIWLHSDPVLVGTVTADDNGAFDTTITIPVDTPIGGHSIEVFGVKCKISAWAPISVFAANALPTTHRGDGTASDGSLSYTGIPTGMVTLVAAGLLALGAATTVASSRRARPRGRHV